MKKITKDDPYICNECAIARKGKWPEGHCATMHRAKCPYCGLKKTLACIGDYNWPKNNFEYMRD